MSESKDFPKPIKNILGLIVAKREDLTQEEMYRCLAADDPEMNVNSFLNVINDINTGFRGELLLEIDNNRVREVGKDKEEFKDWLLGLKGEPPCVFKVDGQRLFGQWAVSEWRAYFSNPEELSAVAETALPYWMEHGAIHLMADFKERYKVLYESSNWKEIVLASAPLISAIDLLATLQQHAADHDSTVIDSVVRESLPHLAACLKECEPPFSEDSRTTGGATFLTETNEVIGRMKILDLFSESYATEHLALVLRWIVRTFFLNWSEVVEQMLAKGDYVVRFAVAEGQAERFAKLVGGGGKNTQQCQGSTAVKELRDLLESSDINRQEMGCYAVASVAESFLVGGESQDALGADGVIEIRGLVHQVAAMKYYFARSALGDMLIRLGMHSESGVRMINALSEGGKLDPVWNCHWEHTQLDTEFLRGAGVHPQYPLAVADASAEPTWYQQQVERAQQAMRGLKTDNAWLHDSLLRKFRVIGCESATDEDLDIKLNEDAEHELRQWIFNHSQSEKVQDLVEVMFLHPLWSVIERVASELTGLATRSDEWRVTITDLVLKMMVKREKQEWRIDYGVNEWAYLMRPIQEHHASSKHIIGGQRLFDLAVLNSFKHDVSRVRANLAENFVADLKSVWGLEKRHRDGSYIEGAWLNRLCDSNWIVVIDRWLRDTDAWVLEHIYRLFGILQKIKTTSPMGDDSVLGQWLDDRLTKLMESGNEMCMLAIVHTRAVATGMTWAELQRREFLDYLEDAKAAMS